MATVSEVPGDDEHRRKSSGQSKTPPNKDGASQVQYLAHRRNRATGMFVSLRAEDRQMYLPFIPAEHN